MTTSTRTVAIDTRTRLFRGLADPSRLSILEAVCSGPRSVGEIVDHTGLGQSNVSNHLACLLECGLVTREQRGRFAFYELADPRVERLLLAADELIADVARGVEGCRHCERRGGP